MNTVLNSLPEVYRNLHDPDCILDQAEKRKDVSRVVNIAAKCGFQSLIDKAIERGYSLNPDNSKGPLFFALSSGKIELADHLKECGADVNHIYQKRSLLSHAAEVGSVAAVKYLLENRASVNGSNSYSPLHWATKNRHLTVVNILLHKGANPNKEGSKGTFSPKVVPLALALEACHYELISSLLRGGANPRGKGCYIPQRAGVDINELMKEYKNRK